MDKAYWRVFALLTGSVLLPSAVAWATEGKAVDEATEVVLKTEHADDGHILFSQQLRGQADINLQGTHAVQHVDVPMPRSWEATGDPTLHLVFSHSASLLPWRSHLTVLLNGQAIGSVALDEHNADGASLDVTLPRALLKDYNDLSFSVVQHFTDDCEDPFDPALWTRISQLSSVDIPHRRLPVTDGLEAWPFPVLDARGYGPLEITPLLGRAPDADTAKAGGVVAVALGRLASYRTVQVEPAVAALANARTPVLAVGPLDTLPGVAELLGGPQLGPDDGLVAVVPNPADNTLPVLVVTGGGAEGLRRAAAALAGQDRQPVLAGPVALVKQAIDGSPPPSYETPTLAPKDGDFAISRMGFKDHTVRGYFPEAIRIPLRMEGDSTMRPGGGSLSVHYAYAAQLDTSLSTMEVRLDGLPLRSVALDQTDGEQDAVLEVKLPEEVLDPDSRVDVVFHLFPRGYDACHHVADSHIWGTVFARSSIVLPRDNVAKMPDLAYLRYGLWPFTSAPGAAPVTVAVSDEAGGEAWAGALELTAALGRRALADAPALALTVAGNAPFDQRKDDHYVLVVDRTPHALYDTLVKDALLPIRAGADARDLQAPGKDPLASTRPDTEVDTIEEVLQPANPERVALVVRAGNAGAMVRLVDTIVDPALSGALSGNAAVISAAGDVRTVATAETRTWGTVPVMTGARREVRHRWGLLGAGVAGAGLLLAVAVRRLSRGSTGR